MCQTWEDGAADLLHCLIAFPYYMSDKNTNAQILKFLKLGHNLLFTIPEICGQRDIV